MLLAAERVHHRRLEALAERQQLMVRTLASRAAQDGRPAFAVQQRREPVEITARGRHDRRGRQQPIEFTGGASLAGCSATSPGSTSTDTPRLPTASRIATSSARGI